MKGHGVEGTHDGDTEYVGEHSRTQIWPLNSSGRLQAWPGRHQQPQGVYEVILGGCGGVWGDMGVPRR